MYDRRSHHLDCVSDRLCGVPCTGRREVIGLYRLAGSNLFPDPGIACSARVRHVTPGYFDANSGISAPLGPAPPDGAVDYADLALRFGDRSICVPNALSLVPARAPAKATTPSVGHWALNDLFQCV